MFFFVWLCNNRLHSLRNYIKCKVLYQEHSDIFSKFRANLVKSFENDYISKALKRTIDINILVLSKLLMIHFTKILKSFEGFEEPEPSNQWKV